MFILVACLSAIACTTGVEINTTSPVIVTAGDAGVTLPCVFKTPSKDNQFHVHWSRGDKYGPMVLTKEVSGKLWEGDSYQGRVEFKDISSLVLRDPAQTDSGLYTCTVIIPSDVQPTSSKSVQLSVIDKPTNSSVITIGVPVIVTCVMTGSSVGCVYMCVKRLKNKPRHAQSQGFRYSPRLRSRGLDSGEHSEECQKL